jgi:DNA gyrase subunit B
MTELIKRGHVYIAQPPLYRIKKGKFEQYIKDDREFVTVMVKRASDGIVVRYGANAATLEGAALTRFMGHLNEYLGFFDKVNKRLRNEEVTALLAKLELVKRADFESESSAPSKLVKLHAKLEALAKKYQFKSVDEPIHDEEHHTYSLCFHDAQGAERRIDWTLATSPEYRQMMSKYMLIKEPLEGPFLIESASKAATASEDAEAETAETAEGAGAKPAAKRAAKAAQDPVEKQSPRELFEYVIEQGRKDYQVQRYKGLGEMSDSQLWETTMDPERRTLLQVKLEDLAESEQIFSTLMGEDVEARRKFIEDNALDVKNLDI